MARLASLARDRSARGSLGGRRLLSLRRAARAVSPARLDTGAADGCHVRTIAADDLTTLAPRCASLVGRDLVRSTLGVRGLPALARDLALPLEVHGREPPVALRTLRVALGAV